MGRYTDELQTDGRLNVAIPNLEMETYIMTVYMVERDLPGITLEQLGGAQKSPSRPVRSSPARASRCGTYGAPISPVSPA